MFCGTGKGAGKEPENAQNEPKDVCSFKSAPLYLLAAVFRVGQEAALDLGAMEIAILLASLTGCHKSEKNCLNSIVLSFFPLLCFALWIL